MNHDEFETPEEYQEYIENQIDAAEHLRDCWLERKIDEDLEEHEAYSES